MKYPKFIKQNGTIGICAPSAGIGLKSEDFDKSLNVLKQHGYHIIETESVRSTELRSADAKTRAKELKELFTNDKVDIVMAAAGAISYMKCLTKQTLKQCRKILNGY